MFQVKLKADLSDLERLAAKYPDAARGARITKVTEALNLLEREVVKRTPYGAGPIHLRDTIHGRVSISGSKVAGILGTSLEYGEPVELGTRPHFPPIGPLQFWVEKKLGYTGREAASVAFLIARAISRRGTSGAEMFERGFGASRAQVIRILEEIPGEIVREISV